MPSGRARGKPLPCIIRLVAALFLLTGMWANAPIDSVQAANRIVSNNSDSGDGSLRQAVAVANPSDTITFDAGLSGQTILLASRITINKSLTIDASSLAAPVSISGGDLTQLFEVSAGTVAMKGFIFIHGVKPKGDEIGPVPLAGSGGAIQNAANLSIENCTFAENQALQGGAIHNTGILLIKSTTFADNISNWGGGVFNSGIANVSNSTFTGNGKYAFGGGIDNNGTLTITDSSFAANSAYGGGGGISNSGNLQVSNSTFDHNEGGGIKNHAGSTKSVIFTNNVFTNNYQADGAGINNVGVMTVNNNTLSGNLGNDGGAIYNSGEMTAENNSLSDNTANNGGGFYNEGTLTARNNTFTGNSSSRLGGGIYNQNNLISEKNTFANNNGYQNGGGIYNTDELAVSNCTLSGNTSHDGSGGIYNNGWLVVTNSTVSGNSTSYGIVGGIYNNNLLTLKNTILANSEGGPDCYNDSSGGVSHQSDLIENNASANDCGMPFLTGDPMLGPLADNGGVHTGPSTNAIVHPFTMSLLEGSPAIDAGDSAACAAIGGKDQRGVSRPVGTGCDLGALEVNSVPEIVPGSSSPVNGEVVLTRPIHSKVVFDQDMDPASAQDSDNYLLVSSGQNNAFDTQSCRTGLAGDDVQIPIGPVSYNAATRTTTVTVNGGSPLPNGSYKLFVCGTTSITDIYGLKLNLGLSDTTIAFTVNAPVSKLEIPEVLPATGFAPAHKTALPLQPAAKNYTESDLVLEIPSLRIQRAIQSVPSTEEEWDLSWLGDDIGYLEGTAFPTNSGNSVLTGHVYNADGLPGPFINLGKMKWGERIIIRGWGQEYIYEVRVVEDWVNPSDTRSISHEEKLPWLTLITCQGYDQKSGGYQYRVVVRAVLVEIH